jgi:GT2 family glycosyltransferase
MLKASVVIATLNRDEQVIQVLRDLMEQTYQYFEVIISNEIGITNAMNTSLKSATGDIIIRIDDDVRLNPHWLEQIIYVFNNYPDSGGVTGPTIVPAHLRKNRDLFAFESLPQPLKWLYVNYFQEGNPYALAHMNKCGAFSLGSNYEISHLSEQVIQCDYLESTNYALRTELVRSQGGWDPKFDGVCEYFEQDMVYKIKKLGWKMYYNPKAYLYHEVNSGGNFNARQDYVSRLRNWIRFSFRHLAVKDSFRLVSYFLFQCGYYAYKSITRKSLRSAK